MSQTAANLNIHLHCLGLDGVHRSGADGVPTFVEAGAASDDELHALLQTVITRLMNVLTRRGVLIEDMLRSMHMQLLPAEAVFEVLPHAP